MSACLEGEKSPSFFSREIALGSIIKSMQHPRPPFVSSSHRGAEHVLNVWEAVRKHPYVRRQLARRRLLADIDGLTVFPFVAILRSDSMSEFKDDATEFRASWIEVYGHREHKSYEGYVGSMGAIKDILWMICLEALGDTFIETNGKRVTHPMHDENIRRIQEIIDAEERQ